MAADTQTVIGTREIYPSETITCLDLRGKTAVDWKTVDAIGLSFPPLSSLSTWFAVQHWLRQRLPARWELRQMNSLRHLSIAINARNRYSDSSWESPGAEYNPEKAFDLRVLPHLETLKIPVRLFKEPEEDWILPSSDVLPPTLKTLVLFINLQPNTQRKDYDEEIEWDKYWEFLLPNLYHRSCAQSIRLTIRFLRSLKDCAQQEFPNLRRVTLEYDTGNEDEDENPSFRRKAMERFTRLLQDLQDSFWRRGVYFDVTKL